ncbi:MAG: hypothetical protein ACHQ7N_08915 [Candidatus Methylomirabilales bacterium]
MVLGQDPFNVELLWDRMYAVMRGRGHSKGYVLEAMSAMDIALWDIIGWRLGNPCTGSWGATGAPRCPCMPRRFSSSPQTSWSERRSTWWRRATPA